MGIGRRVGAVAACAALVSTAACSAGADKELSAPPPNLSALQATPTPTIGPHGTIVGRFLAVGGPPGAQPTPQRGHVILRQHGRTVVEVTVYRDGHYSFAAPAGSYSLLGHTSQFTVNGRDGRCSAYRTITVKVGGTTHANVYCERV